MIKPDLVIGPHDRPYMLRWHLLRFRGWQLALHKICRSDDERACHDHKADNLSIILRGQYTEVRGWRFDDSVSMAVHGSLSTIFRKAEQLHRLVLNKGEHVWTLWLRWPPRRKWGFMVPGVGWMTAEEYFKRYGEDAT